MWAIILGLGILLFPETPKYAFRGHEAKRTMVRPLGVSEHHYKVEKELFEALDAEHAGSKPRWYEMFTRPRMAYRTILGVVLQALQQLTGANFFLLLRDDRVRSYRS